MTNEVQIFNNPEFGEIRTVTIDNEPWFVGKDVAGALGYSNSKDAMKQHIDSEDKQVIQRSQNTTLEIPNRGLTIINESGLYSLILSSKLPSAKKFKRWVTSEVLPAIRKTGTYGMAPQRELTKDDYIKAASMISSCKNERLPYVLGFLEEAGFKIPQVEQVQQQSVEQDNIVDVELLSRLICESGLSLNKLSELTNVCRTSLYYYKNKKMKPTPERYAVLIQALS